MEIKIQAVKFDATEKLQEFVQKKVSKLERVYEGIEKVDVQLKVLKPATAMNKEAKLSLVAPGASLFVEKTCDTFEECIDLCVDALKVQIEKIKEKQRNF